MEKLNKNSGWFYIWAVAFCWALLGVIEAHAAGVGGAIPQIAQFMNTLQGTVTGPVGSALFFGGVVKGAMDVRRCGVEGLMDSGTKIAGAGALIGGAPWLAQQFSVSGAVLS